jgi:hypothetical protein
VIVIAGLGNADHIAEDHGLALLRVYAADELAPVALAEEPPAGNLTIVGIADPQAQGGAAAVTQVSARIAGATRTIEPVPVLGFAGAAATDNQGRVAWLVTLKAAVSGGNSATQASVIPSDTIRKFLAAAKITPGNAGYAKASVMRVTCVRK